MSQNRCHCIAIVGTDTGVGKTVVACALASAWRQRGCRVAPFKPAESGCDLTPHGLCPADTLKLIDCSGCRADQDLINPYRFAPPLSPAAASLVAGRSISLDRVVRCFNELKRTHEILVMEGAGGLMVPFGPGWLFADLLEQLGIPILLVGRSGLGTINHCLLTIREMNRRKLNVLGVVLNRLTPTKGPDEESNPQAIRSFGKVRVLGILPYLSHTTIDDPVQLASIAESHINIKSLTVR